MTKSSNTNYPNTSQKESHQSGIHTSLVSPKSITRHGHNRKVGKSPGRTKRIKVVIASGLHLYPYRTEKLNLITPMVLRKRESREPPPRAPETHVPGAFFSYTYPDRPPPNTPQPGPQQKEKNRNRNHIQKNFLQCNFSVWLCV